MYCIHCDKEYEGKFCPECGTRLIERPVQPGGFNLNLGDANAISGGVHLSESHNVNNSVQNIDNSVNNTNNVYNNTVYEAQKTAAELQQDNESQFMMAVQLRMADGLLDQRELQELKMLATQLCIPPQRALQIVDQVRRSATAMRGGQGVEFLLQQTLEEVYNAISCNQVNILRRRLSSMEQLAQSTPDDNVQFYYHLLFASLTPEVCVISFLNARTDNYWQLFWAHIAYVKLGQIDNATNLLPRMGGFGAPQGDIALLMAIDNLAEYRKTPDQDYYIIQAQDKLLQAQQLGLSNLLNAMWYATKEAMMEEQNPDEWFRFYVEQTVKEMCPMKTPPMPEIPQTEIPPLPKSNAQDVNLSQMQGFNPLEAAKKLGLGMAESIKNDQKI